MRIGKNFYENLIKEARKFKINKYVVRAVISKGSSILLLKRPKNDSMGGIYELPGGKVEEGEQLDEALYREVEEETGLKVKEIKVYLGHFDYESKDGEKTRQFNFVVIIKEFIEIKLQEHDDYAWVDKDQLSRYPTTNNMKNMLYLFWEKNK